MQRRLNKLFLWISLFVLFIILIFIVLYSFTGVIDKTALSILNSVTGKNIKIKYSRLEGNLVSHIRIYDLEVVFGKDSLRTERVDVNYSSADLIGGNIDIDRLIIEKPVFILNKGKDSSTVQPVKKTEISPDSLFKPIDLSGLPDLNVNLLRINDGTVRYQTESGTDVFDEINLQSRIAIHAEDVRLDMRRLSGNWKGRNLAVEQAAFKLSGSQKRVTLNQFEIQSNAAQITAHGEIELKPHLRFLIFSDTSRIDVGILHNVLPGLPFKAGNVTFSGNYIGNPDYFNGSLFMKGTLDTLHFERLQAKYSYDHGTVTARNLDIRTNFGVASGSATISPQGNNAVKLDFSGINLQKIDVTSFRTDINGWLNLQFDSWNINRLSGEGSAFVHNSTYGKVHFDTLYMNLRARNGNWKIGQNSRFVLQKQSRFYVEGGMSRDEILNLRLYTENNSLDTLDKRLGLNLLGGHGSMNVTVTGHLRNPDITGKLLLDSLTVAGNSAYGIEGRFEVQNLMENRSGFLDLNLAAGIFAGVTVTDGQMALQIEQNTVIIDSIAFRNHENVFQFAGYVRQQEDSTLFRLRDVRIRYQNYEIYSPDTLKAFLHNDSLQINDFVLNAPSSGEIEVRGMLNFSGKSGIAVYFSNIRLAPFNEYINWKYKIRGRAEISLEITGNPDSLYFDNILEIRELALGSDTLGTLTTKFSYDNKTISIERFHYQHGPESYLSLSGQFTLPEQTADSSGLQFREQKKVDLNLEFSGIKFSDFPFFREYNYPVTGSFGGKVRIEGTPAAPRGTYLLTGNEVRIQDYYFPAFSLDGRISPSRIQLDMAQINFMNTDITAQGFKTINWDLNRPENIFADKRFSLFVKIQEDTVRFLDVVLPEVDILSGDINLSAKLGGDWDRPQLLEGDVNISDGTLYLAKVENPLTNLELRADVQEHKLVIHKGAALLQGEIEPKNIFQKFTSFIFSPIRKLLFSSEKQGQVSFAGSIDLSELTRPRFDLRVRAQKAYVNYFLENAELVFTTDNLQVSGRDTIFVRGDVLVQEGDIELDLQESEKNVLLSPSVRETPPYMQYLINLEIPGNFYVRSEATFNSFELQLEGELRIIQDPKSLMEIYGTLDVPGGKYFQFEEFDIRDGQVDFANPKEIPRLSIVAEKQKYGYIFELRVNGPLNNPTKDIRIYDSDTGEDITGLYPETKDKIALLIFGVPFNQLGGNTGSIILGKGQEILSQALISQIESEARRFIGLDEIRVESQDTRNSQLNQSSSESSLALGKYLTPKLYLEYTTRLSSAGLPGLGSIPAPTLSWEAGNQLYLEYRINRNWSVSTFYEKKENDRFKIDLSWRLNF